MIAFLRHHRSDLVEALKRALKRDQGRLFLLEHLPDSPVFELGVPRRLGVGDDALAQHGVQLVVVGGVDVLSLGARFADDGARARFGEALALHCHEASKIVERFSGDWYGKNVYQGDGLTPNKVEATAIPQKGQP